jgi:hypothetical protein
LEAAGKAKTNPSQKSQLDQFLYRIFRTLAPKDIPKGLIKDLVAFLSEVFFLKFYIILIFSFSTLSIPTQKFGTLPWRPLVRCKNVLVRRHFPYFCQPTYQMIQQKWPKFAIFY